MKYKILRLISGIILLIAFVVPIMVTAQDEQPAPMANVIGDTNSSSLQVVQSYLNSRDPNLLADDAIFFDQTLDQSLQGRDAIDQMQVGFYNNTFTNVETVPTRFIVAGNTIVAEFLFNGTNTGSYLGAPATNAAVSVPMVGIYEVNEQNQITNIRRYYDAVTLQNQIGYPYGYSPGVAPGAPINPVDQQMTVDTITDDPGAFYGQTVTIDGNVGEAIGDKAFAFYDSDLITPDGMIVLETAQDETDFIQLADARIRVTGTVRQFDMSVLEAEVGYDVDDSLFPNYQTWPVIVAQNIENLDNPSTIQNIVDNPEAFYNEQVTVEGNLGDPMGTEGAFIYEDALLDVDRVLVIGASPETYDFANLPANLVSITGIVRSFNQAEIESEYGFDLADELFSGYEGQPVIIADQISPMQ